jgi:hypothetical protein
MPSLWKCESETADYVVHDEDFTKRLTITRLCLSVSLYHDGGVKGGVISSIRGLNVDR